MTSASAGSTLDAYVVGDDTYAILVLAGIISAGCSWQLKDVLLASEKRDHGHVIVDVRNVQSMTREAIKIFLWELGRAFDDGRTLRLVVRDEHQKRALDGMGIAGMLPTHLTLQDAMLAVDEVQAAHNATEHVIDLDMHPNSRQNTPL